MHSAMEPAVPTLQKSSDRSVTCAISINTLGGLQIHRAGQPLPLTRPRRSLDLLGSLVAAGARGLPTSSLREAIWPHSSREARRRSLITTTFRLRRLLGTPHAVRYHDDSVSLDPLHCWIDAWEFEHRMTHASGEQDLLAALVCYRGPLCPGLGNEFLRSARERLRSLYCNNVAALSRTFAAQRRLAEARWLLRHAVVAEPTAESLYLLLIELLGQMGLATEATTAYEQCALALRRHLGILPSTGVRNAWKAATLGQRRLVRAPG